MNGEEKRDGLQNGGYEGGTPCAPIRTPRMELMAPAGSEAALAAAIRAGADSVYFGVGTLHMRARSSGLSIEDLPRIARRCRAAGIRSYLTLNTVLLDDEMDEMERLCNAACDAEISAVIACDPAVLDTASQLGLEVHLSVQANVSNYRALAWYARYADTVVLARELTLDQIRTIAQQVQQQDLRGPSGHPVRIEIFAHGALCVALSGKCHMSLALNNRSANRGACVQPCRRSYRVTDEETGAELVIDNHYVMSPRDLCTIQYLDQIADAGVSVLKIEGRARPAAYVDTVVRAYREALDALEAGTYSPDRCTGWIRQLERVFHRGFWHGGYYCGAPLGEWAAAPDSQATEQRHEIGHVSNYFRQLHVAEFPVRRFDIANGNTLMIEGPTTGVLRFELSGLRVDGKPADRAVPGDLATVAVPRKVRRNDKIFILHSRKESAV